MMGAIVIGGSLGGLTAALVLRDRGWDIDILERTPNPLEGRGTGIVVHPNTVGYLLERAGRPISDMGLPAHRAVLPFTSADANARAMSSELTTSTEGSVLASSASWAGATVCSRRARSRLQAMTTLRA